MIGRPDGLDARGEALWDALTAERSWDAAGLALVAEACRMADRLERLDQLLRGETDVWTRIVVNYAGSSRSVELEIDGALAEARQLQATFLQVLTKLGLGRSESAATVKDPLVDLVARRAARLAAAAAG